MYVRVHTTTHTDAGERVRRQTDACTQRHALCAHACIAVVCRLIHTHARTHAHSPIMHAGGAHAGTHVLTHAHTHTRTHARTANTHTSTFRHTHKPAHLHSRTHTCLHTCSCVHTHIQSKCCRNMHYCCRMLSLAITACHFTSIIHSNGLKAPPVKRKEEKWLRWK